MQIKDALFYPYRKENWVRTLLIPSLYTIGIMVIFGLLGVIGAFVIPKLLTPSSPSTPLMTMLFMIIMILVFLLFFIAMLPLYGYHWELIATLQTKGLTAQAPAWQGMWKHYFVTGFHSFLSWLLLGIPLIISYLTLGLLTPFVLAPFFLAAQDKTVGSVLANIGPGLELVSERYLPILGTLYLIVGLILVAIIPYYILSFTIVGGMAFMTGLGISFLHLMTQAFTPDPVAKR